MKEVIKLRQGLLRAFHPSLWPVKPCRCLKDGMYIHTLMLHVATQQKTSGTVMERLRGVFKLKQPVRIEHMRLKDPEKACFRHKNCASIGNDATELQCQQCTEISQ